MIDEINDALYNEGPCDLCFCFGYLFCICTAGLSFCCPYMCMRDMKLALLRKIESINNKMLF
jgi:hypothetical protein